MFSIGQIWRHSSGSLYKILDVHSSNRVTLESLRTGNKYPNYTMIFKHGDWTLQSPIEEYV